MKVYDKNIQVISLNTSVLPLNTMQYGLIFVIGIAKALDYMIQCGDIEEIINRYQIKGENNKNERFTSLTFIKIALRE